MFYIPRCGMYIPECTFHGLEYTFQGVEYTFQPMEHKTYPSVKIIQSKGESKSNYLEEKMKRTVF